MKIKLKNIFQDPKLLELRKMDEVVVRKYREAMRSGANFPPIIVDQNKIIVSGNYRYTAMLKEYGEEQVVTIVKKKFTNKRERLEFFARENATHGAPLDNYSKAKISVELIKVGATSEEVSKILNVPVKKVVLWGDNQVMVILGNGKSEYRPVKYGMENIEKPMSKKEHQDHQKDRGITISQQVNQLLRWLSYDRVARTDKNIQLLEELHELIQEWLDTMTAEELDEEEIEDVIA